ncbi:MAG: antibiotic biosynthesis monooxygenase [Nitriliruptorales bacterium]|nr:antibiotic biosynthesis monooxygenase [Nitriliruptorales bacterium]
MSVVRINVLDIPEGMGEMLESRFASRAGEVDQMPGFEEFALLRPTDGSNRYYVYTRWATAEDFDNWVNSSAFQHGHAKSSEQPVGTGSEILAFDVVVENKAG